MLKGIDSLLSGELLNILESMGHGDQLALVDRNYPATASVRPVVRLSGAGTIDAARAILSVFPLDSFVDRPLERMLVDGEPETVTGNQAKVLRMASDAEDRTLEFGPIPRLDFYQRAKSVFAVVQTTDDQPYGCFILQKGVV